MSFSVFVVCFVLLAMLVHVQRKVFYHCRVVERNKLYRSGTLKSNLCFRFVVTWFGINTVVNLRSVRERGLGDWYQRQMFMCQKLGIELIDIPMDEDTPPTKQQIEAFCELLDQPDQRTLVHCEYGIIRTGMMIFAYAQHGMSESHTEAKRHFLSFGHRLHRHLDAVSFIENYRIRPSSSVLEVA